MIRYREGLGLLCRVYGSILHTAIIYSLPSVALAALLVFAARKDPLYEKVAGMMDITKSQVWTAMSFVVYFLLGFRATCAYQRYWEAANVLHQLRGEWFDSASCLWSFSRENMEKKPKEVFEARQSLARLFSLMHGFALEDIGRFEHEVLDFKSLDQETVSFLKDCPNHLGFDRVEACQHMIQVLITQNIGTGVFTIPPPIMARAYQSLSRGLVHCANLHKIMDTKFPFPYAQIITFILVVHCVFTPLLMAQIIAEEWWVMVVTFIPVFGPVSLNLSSVILENPFGNEPNSLPMAEFQQAFNDCMMLLLHGISDRVPGTCSNGDKARLIQNAYAGSAINPTSTALELEDEFPHDSKPRGLRNRPTPPSCFNNLWGLL